MIRYGSVITQKKLKEISQLQYPRFYDVFEKRSHKKRPSDFRCTFIVELICDECQESFFQTLSANRVFGLIRTLQKGRKNRCECSKCTEKKKQLSKPKVQERTRRNDEPNTEDNKSSFEKEIDRDFWWFGLKWIARQPQISFENYEELRDDYFSCPAAAGLISNAISRMDYHEFLQTPYWKCVSDTIKHRAGRKCCVCGSVKNLNVHHKNYGARGYEHLTLEYDLICLCNDCHKKIHGKE